MKVARLFLILFVVGCSLDYREAAVEEKLAEEIPNTVLNKVVHTIVQDGMIKVVLEAEKAENYAEREEMSLKGIHFKEFDDKGEIVIEGWADQAVFYTDTENAYLEGSIYFYSYLEEAGIFAESFSFDKEEKSLRSSKEHRVTIERDDGSYIEGSGFEADFRRKVYQFSSEVEGKYVEEENN